MDVTNAVAERILEAYAARTPIPPVRGEVSGVAAAYRVQSLTTRHWLERGRRLCGRKIGLTAKAVQVQLGVDEPDFGALFSDMILHDGASVAPEAVLQPRIEGEIAFILKTSLGGPKVTPEAVIAATDYVVPAIEICGSRIAGWDIRIEDTIADNASSGLVVLGEQRTKPSLAELADVPLRIEQNGALAAEGRGDACLGNPAIAVAWLAEALSRFGEELRAGDVVMSGALAKMLTARPGDRFAARFGAMGEVAVSFAA